MEPLYAHLDRRVHFLQKQSRFFPILPLSSGQSRHFVSLALNLHACGRKVQPHPSSLVEIGRADVSPFECDREGGAAGKVGCGKALHCVCVQAGQGGFKRVCLACLAGREGKRHGVWRNTEGDHLPVASEIKVLQPVQAGLRTDECVPEAGYLYFRTAQPHFRTSGYAHKDVVLGIPACPGLAEDVVGKLASGKVQKEGCGRIFRHVSYRFNR